MFNQSRHCLLEHCRRHGLPWLEQQRLVEMIAMLQRLREEPMLNGRQGERSRRYFVRGFCDDADFGDFSQSCDSLMLEQSLHRKLQTRLARFRNDANGEYRIAAEREEVIVN